MEFLHKVILRAKAGLVVMSVMSQPLNHVQLPPTLLIEVFTSLITWQASILH